MHPFVVSLSNHASLQTWDGRSFQCRPNKRRQNPFVVRVSNHAAKQGPWADSEMRRCPGGRSLNSPTAI
jgi:hypothetical protein